MFGLEFALMSAVEQEVDGEADTSDKPNFSIEHHRTGRIGDRFPGAMALCGSTTDTTGNANRCVCSEAK